MCHISHCFQLIQGLKHLYILNLKLLNEETLHDSLKLLLFWCHSDVYPDGLPSDYSIIATFKLTKDSANKSWDLWQDSDPKGRDHVGLRFHGDTRSLDFFYTGPDANQMVRTFRGVEELFDGKWHKLALSVKGGRVKLLVDCEEVSVESVDEPRPLILQGYTSIVKRAVGDLSVSVCWQLGFLCHKINVLNSPFNFLWFSS